MAKEREEKAPDQQKQLDNLLVEMRKKFGSDSISLFGQNKVQVKWVPLNSFYLTEIMGKGFPRGRMIEIYGPESSGKSSLAEFFGGQVQQYFFEDKKRYGVVAYIDVEHALDPEYARSYGLNVDKMIFSQPDSAEQALNMVEDLLRSGLVDLIVVDSVAALTPQAEIDGEMGDAHMALQARLMSQACRKLQCLLKPDSASIIWVNQTRSTMSSYGNPETTTGGNALKFYASIRLTVRKGEKITGKNIDDVIGMESNIKCIKNKVSRPFQSCTMKIIFGEGYSVDEEFVMAFGIHKIIERGGAGWYTLQHEGKPVKFQGCPAVIKFLLEHPALYAELKGKLYRIMQSESQKVTEVLAEEVEATDEAIAQEAAIQTSLEKEAFEETDPIKLAALAGSDSSGDSSEGSSTKKPVGKHGELLEVSEEDLQALEGKKR